MRAIRKHHHQQTEQAPFSHGTPALGSLSGCRKTVHPNVLSNLIPTWLHSTELVFLNGMEEGDWNSAGWNLLGYYQVYYTVTEAEN